MLLPRGNHRNMPTAREYNALRKGTWVGDLGIEIVSVEAGRLIGAVAVRKELLSPNGFLHAGCIITLADSMCGSGTMENLPNGARGYTTLELKANLLGTARDGPLECEATLVHGGRTTQVWDAKVTSKESGKTLALFRCTQLILYPEPVRAK
jgi:1,4-dihydroxy-2-naphthoyl-CoA hydrolase